MWNNISLISYFTKKKNEVIVNTSGFVSMLFPVHAKHVFMFLSSSVRAASGIWIRVSRMLGMKWENEDGQNVSGV